MSSDVLSEEQENTLADRALALVSGPLATKRKVSVAFRRSPPTSIQSDQPHALTVTYHGFSSDNAIPTGMFELPRHEDSIEALEWIGLNHEAATAIHDRYSTRETHEPFGLLDYVNGHIDGLAHRHSNLSHTETMAVMGIRETVQQAILDPDHSTVFETETLVFWLKDTLRIKHLSLELLNRRLVSAAIQQVSPNKQQKRPRLPDSFGDQRPKSPSVTATFNIAQSKDFNLPEKLIAVAAEPRDLPPSHTRLFKAKSAAEMYQWIEDDGSVDMAKLATWPRGDFNGTSNAWYFTKEKECAEKYREFAERRCPQAETWLMSLDVPDTFLASIKREDLYYTYDWKRYIWLCKKSDLNIPTNLRRYAEEADLIVGHVCGKDPKAVTKHKKDDVQTAITEEFVMKLPSGQKATQHIFMKPKVARDLATHIRGKVHVDITASKLDTDKTILRQ